MADASIGTVQNGQRRPLLPMNLVKQPRHLGLVESVCRITFLSCNHFFAKGARSTFRLAPGPGVSLKNSLLKTNVSGWSRWTAPHDHFVVEEDDGSARAVQQRHDHPREEGAGAAG